MDNYAKETKSTNRARCLNIDWLELYCLESGNNFPHNADYFRSCGYEVNERDYGTRQYEEMFTICDDHGHGFLEVRRKPVSGDKAKLNKGIFSPFSCHLKLVNRYCYAPNAIDLLSAFLRQHGYTIQRIFRLDLALDFERFDDNTDPNAFLKRYLDGKFTKVNQGNISAHGADRWEGRFWHSVSWGSAKSMVSTKMYDKTIELSQVKDKPYIRYAWFTSGLVDDFQTLQKKGKDNKPYKPHIWRLEFSIKSSAKGWLIVENNDGKQPTEDQVPHTIDAYDTPEKRLLAFQMLTRHYFHFKYYEEGKRKDLCKDRVLFNWGHSDVIYKLDRLLTDKPKDRAVDALKARLQHYRNTHFDNDVRKACDIIIQQLELESIRNATPTYDRNESTLLQMLINRRLSNHDETFSESIEIVRTLLNLHTKIF